MAKLIVLFWGCTLLMYLSQKYYPDGDVRNIRRGGNFMWDRGDLFLTVIICWLTGFMFLRTSYNDTGNYIFEWERVTVPLAEFLRSGELTELGSNPLYDLYRTVMRELTDNYHWFFFFPALLSSLGAVKLIKRFSPDPAFSMIVFFSIGTYIMYLAAMKQCFAIAILCYALPFALDGKYVRFTLLVLLAMLFHTHAFIFLAVPLMFGRPWGWFTWVVFVLALAAMAFYDRTFGALMEFALSLGVNVAEFELFDGHSINPIRILVYGIPAALSFVFRRRLYENSTREENLFANMSVFTVFILMIGLVQGANLFARMAAYYEIALCISFPWMIRKIFERRSAQIVTVIASACFFVYFLYEFGISKGFGSNYRAITFWQFLGELAGLR